MYISIALLVFFLCSYFIECRSCFIPVTLYASPDAFLPNTFPAQIIPKTSLRHAVRRFVHCELRKRARNTRLDSGCCHRSVDNRMGSRLVGEYVSQTANVLCSVLKVCSIIWRCFVFLDITEEMFLATDLVLSLQWSKTLKANYKTYSHWCSKSTAARQCTQVLIPIMTIISSYCIPSCKALGIDD